MLGPARVTSSALLVVGLSVSVWALTTLDLYGPGTFFRLHALAEAFLPGALLHLALVFPVRRTSPRRAVLIAYAPAAALALALQAVLFAPRFYPHVHAVVLATTAVAALDLIVAIFVGYVRSPSELIRHRVRIACLGLVAAFVNPVLVLTLSILDGGRMPLTLTGFTAFVFPLAVAWAAHKRDLFEIDGLVRHGTTSAVLSSFVTASYLLVSAIATQIVHVPWHGESTLPTVLFLLGVVLAFPRLRATTQRLVDRLWTRQVYDPHAVLAASSTALTTTLRLDEVLGLVTTIPQRALDLQDARVLVRDGYGFAEPASASTGATTSALDDPALPWALAAHPEPVVRVPGRSGPAQEALARLRAEVLVPLVFQGDVHAVLACGRKRSGADYNVVDVRFLGTFANQAALALVHARTFHALETLNAELEERVAERTTALDTSLASLARAYRALETSQEQLVAAQRMAALGRLVAGISHEVSSPLGAALNGLHLASALTTECGTRSGDALRETLGELGATLAQVEACVRKVGGTIRGVKSQAQSVATQPGPIALEALLSQRLTPMLLARLAETDTALAVRVSPQLPALEGDGERLVQVLANLIHNAIDASRHLPAERRRIVVDAIGDGAAVVVRVRDRGPGIPAGLVVHLFDAYGAGKTPGAGAGLGLMIARDIVRGEFGGTIECSSSGPEGSTFTVRLPLPTGAACTTSRAA
jgi:signal transduction histidine kinase